MLSKDHWKGFLKMGGDGRMRRKGDSMETVRRLRYDRIARKGLSALGIWNPRICSFIIILAILK